MNAPLPEGLIVPDVDEEVESEILVEIAREWAEEIYAEIDDTFPNYVVSPAVQPPPRERFQKYMLKIVEAYPNDQVGRMRELYMLLDPDYVDAYKLGLVPPPLSRPWALLIKMPRVFKDIQRDLRTCYRTWAQREMQAQVRAQMPPPPEVGY